MNGFEHYQEAERILRGNGLPDIDPGKAALKFARAQVHATLALTAATVDPKNPAWDKLATASE